MSSILDSGITVFVNLQEPTETGMGHRPFRDYRPLVRRLSGGLLPDPAFHRFPIPDMGVTSTETIREALDQIDGAHVGGRVVYIHCWGGHGRTGTVVGCWLVRHGLTPDQALERLTELRQHDDYLNAMGSPQTRAQVQMIRKWAEQRTEDG